MTSFKVDRDILARILAWSEARGIPALREDHATDGLFCADGYLDTIAKEDRDRLFLMALDVTFWFWIDDRIDQNLTKPESLVKWDLLFESLNGRAAPDATEESTFLHQLGAELLPRAKARVDYDWWISSAIHSLRGFREEELIARGDPPPTLVEYLETGAWSMPMPNVVATGSLLCHLDIADRRRDLTIASMDRYLSAYSRLENDLAGVEKERLEKSPSNAVLLMERYMPNVKAREFVLELKKGYAALVHRCLITLPADDPLGRFIRATMEIHSQWYGAIPDRYQEG